MLIRLPPLFIGQQQLPTANSAIPSFACFARVPAPGIPEEKIRIWQIGKFDEWNQTYREELTEDRMKARLVTRVCAE
jgi:hypothetical protein